jgi:hypothetical protein
MSDNLGARVGGGLVAGGWWLVAAGTGRGFRGFRGMRFAGPETGHQCVCCRGWYGGSRRGKEKAPRGFLGACRTGLGFTVCC